MTELSFAKGQALGNDYIVVDAAVVPASSHPSLARGLCDRHRGVGSDGLLLADIQDGRFGLRIFNPDGSEAEKSGNGLRIFGAWLHGDGLVTDEPFHVHLPGESVEMRVLGPLAAGALDIRVEMGRASFRAEDVGFEGGELLDIGEGEAVRVQPVSMGNPHCVVWVGTLDRPTFERIAPRLATHPAFTAGTNVQFARVAGPATLEALIHERGVGETQASGSSASAIAAAAVQSGRAQGPELRVRMPGGTVTVEVDGDLEVRLTGSAQMVFEGRVRAEVVEGMGMKAGVGRWG